MATSGSDVRRVDEGESECGQEHKCQHIGTIPPQCNQVRRLVFKCAILYFPDRAQTTERHPKDV